MEHCAFISVIPSPIKSKVCLKRRFNEKDQTRACGINKTEGSAHARARYC